MEKQVQKKRDGFTGRWGFILACIGSAVGMGNIWRFPVMVSTYGGLTFLIPYFIFVVLIGATGVMSEYALGRAAGTGPIGAFGLCAEQRGKKRIGQAAGVLPILGSMGLAIGYTCVFAWIVKYAVMSVSGELYSMGQDMDLIGATFGQTAGAWGANLWIVLAVILVFGILCLGIARGIERVNKVLMPVLFGLFLLLLVYVAFLPGAGDGYRYIFTFNGQGLADYRVWVYALGQAFFSLSVAGNGSIIYGSYLSKRESIPFAARNVVIFDSLAALLAAFVIIPAMASTGAQPESGGPGLMFIYLVHVLNGMPGGRIIGIVFYVAVLFAGLSSIINLYEAPIECLQKLLGLRRSIATAIILAIGGTAALLIQAIVSEWMDVISIYICPIGALLAGIFFFWVAEKKFANEQVSLGAKKPIGRWFYPLGKYGYCIGTVAVLVLGAILGGIG